MVKRGVPFEFKRVDREFLWDRLLLQLSQVAELTGLDRRRLGYWVAKGYLVPAVREPDRFDATAVEKVLLVRQALSAGIPLRRALKLYDELAAQARRQRGEKHPPSIAALREQLAGVKDALEVALATLDPQVPHREDGPHLDEPPRVQASN